MSKPVIEEMNTWPRNLSTARGGGLSTARRGEMSTSRERSSLLMVLCEIL